jgi:hypothetical protein
LNSGWLCMSWPCVLILESLIVVRASTNLRQDLGHAIKAFFSFRNGIVRMRLWRGLCLLLEVVFSCD